MSKLDGYFKLFHIDSITDGRGSLLVIENFTDVCPFQIKRVYWLFDSDKTLMRGQHAHKNLSQLFVHIQGETKIALSIKDDKREIVLNKVGDALLLKPGVWRVITLKENGILFVLADELYDTNDYIRDEKDFLGLNP